MKFLVYKYKKRQNSNDVYNDIALFLEENNYIKSKQIFLNDIEEREKIGSIKIGSNFYLPHLENDNIAQSAVIRVDNFKYYMLFILVKEQDSLSKNEAKMVVRTLLEKDKRNYLLTCSKVNFELEKGGLSGG